MPLLTETELRERIERWAAIEHGSASPGEREVAELVAAELESLGLSPRLEAERVHGTYWWPVGIPVAAATIAGLVSRGRLAAVVGGLAAAAVADDIRPMSRSLRRLLPQHDTVNLVADIGPADAEQTLVFVAHHDAAHAGLVFHPELPRAFGRRFPALLERSNTTPPTMWGAVIGPALVALGAHRGSDRMRRIGTLLSAGYTAAMADIGLREVVPGANDNLTGVAAILSLAHELADNPPSRLRALLVSTGSEESFMEGMYAFMARHGSELPRDSTTFVCVDTVGSPELLLLEGEGMLGIDDYPPGLLSMIHEVARHEGIFLRAKLRLRNATDGIVALRAGYDAAMIGSVDEFKAPSNYHWPTDTPENVEYGSVANAARLCLALVRRMDGVE